MPDLISIVQKWWKAMAITTVAALLMAALVLSLVPKKYL